MDYEESTIAVYNQHAADFQSQISSDYQSAERQKFILQMPLDAAVLDLGCGTGHDALQFQNQGFTTLAVDGAQGMIELAKRNGVKHTFTLKYSRLEAVDMLFDGIWASQSLIHICKKDLPSVLQKIKHLLKSPGIFYASFRTGEGEELRTNDRFGGGRYFAYYSEDELKAAYNQVFRNFTLHPLPTSGTHSSLAVWAVKE